MQKRTKHKASKWMCLLLLAALIFSCTPIGLRMWRWLGTASGFGDWPEEPGLLEIHIIDVGRADAILIRCGRSTALLDAGQGVSASRVIEYLYRHDVRELDYLIMSHPDRDHIGGMPQVLRELPVKTFVQGRVPKALLPDSLEYQDLQTALEETGITQITLRPGENFSLGMTQLTALGPLKEYKSTNDSSLVLRLNCLDFTALFCGDMEKAAEQDLVDSRQNLHADLLKVGHHGSQTSSTLEFLSEVSPKYAAISVGPDQNKLPREEVLARLEQLGAELYQTDTDGNIVFLYDGNGVAVKTDK